MNTPAITLQQATADDLEAVNQIIDTAVMSWDLPERVKRLSLPSYRYTEHDLDNLKLVVALQDSEQIVGVIAWEPADANDVPDGNTALLVHGLYVNPEQQHQGIGRKLLQAAEKAAHAQNFDGLLVKAQSSATGFFEAQNFEALKVENENRDYIYRYWKLTKER